jgi:uncharacterized protein YabE (DUF348 family)
MNDRRIDLARRARDGSPGELSMTMTVLDEDGKETRRVLVTGATKFAEVRALLN